MEPLSTQLAELLRTMPRLTRLPPNNSSPLLTRWPALAAFPQTTLAQIRCRHCKGEGVTGYSPTDTHPACRPCRGTGLVCPTCHGVRAHQTPGSLHSAPHVLTCARRVKTS